MIHKISDLHIHNKTHEKYIQCRQIKSYTYSLILQSLSPFSISLSMTHCKNSMISSLGAFLSSSSELSSSSLPESDASAAPVPWEKQKLVWFTKPNSVALQKQSKDMG